MRRCFYDLYDQSIPTTLRPGVRSFGLLIDRTGELRRGGQPHARCSVGSGGHPERVFFAKEGGQICLPTADLRRTVPVIVGPNMLQHFGALSVTELKERRVGICMVFSREELSFQRSRKIRGWVQVQKTRREKQTTTTDNCRVLEKSNHTGCKENAGKRPGRYLPCFPRRAKLQRLH